MSDDGRCSHPGFDASEKWCVECVTTLRARLTAAEGLLKRWCLDAKKCTYGPHAFGCITCDTRAFLAAPPGRREAPACTHRCSLVGCNEMGTLVQGTGWLCPKHAALIPAAPIPQPARCQKCGGWFGPELEGGEPTQFHFNGCPDGPATQLARATQPAPAQCSCPFPRDKCPTCAHPCGACEATSLSLARRFRPAPAPETCGTCGLEPGTGLVQPQDKGFPVPCPTCQGQQGPEFDGDIWCPDCTLCRMCGGKGYEIVLPGEESPCPACRPATPGDGRERP